MTTRAGEKTERGSWPRRAVYAAAAVAFLARPGAARAQSLSLQGLSDLTWESMLKKEMHKSDMTPRSALEQLEHAAGNSEGPSSAKSGGPGSARTGNIAVLSGGPFQIPIGAPIAAARVVAFTGIPEAAADTKTAGKDKLIASLLEGDHALSEKEASTVENVLQEYSEEALNRLLADGFRVKVVEHYEGFPSSKFGPASAYYDPGPKKLVIRRDYLEGTLFTWLRTGVKDAVNAAMGEVPWGGPRETFLHEMGHAWNFYLGDAANDPQVKDLFDKYRDASAKDASKRWSYYAAHALDTPDEYLAEGYRMYGQSAKTLQILKTRDPEFFRWLEPRAFMLYGHGG